MASKAEFEDAVLLLQRLHKGKCKGPYSAAGMMYVQTGFTQVNETLLLPQCPIKQNQLKKAAWVDLRNEKCVRKASQEHKTCLPSLGGLTAPCEGLYCILFIILKTYSLYRLQPCHRIHE